MQMGPCPFSLHSVMGTKLFAMRIAWLILQWPYCSCTCGRWRKAIRSAENTNCNFISGPLCTHIIKTKENTNLYSNIPTLLSAAGSVPCAEPTTARLVFILLPSVQIF